MVVNMTDYDSTAYGICISTSITGSGTTAYPAGDRLFFITDKLTGNTQFMQKIKETAGGYSYSTKDGKMGHQVTFGDCIIVSGASVFNTIIPKLKDEHRAGQGVLYLWIKILSAGSPDWGAAANTLYIGYTAAGAETNYMSGYVTRFNWEIEGAIYWIKNLTFKECLV